MKERQTREYRMRQAFGQDALRSLEAQCTADDPPPCSSACPIHLDAKSLCFFAGKGDWAQARKTAEKATFFANTLSCGCEEPCKAACRRAEAGGAIEVSAIERAAMSFPKGKGGRSLPMAPKASTVAVFGAGLFSLSLACELRRKAYPVTLYTLGQSLAGEAARDAGVPAETAALDVQEALSLGFAVREEPLERGEILREAEKHSFAAYSPALFSGFFSREIDPKTCYDAPSGAFSCPENSGCVYSLAFSKTAANSVDRISQKAGLLSGREREGPFETRLYVAMDRVKAVPPAKAGGALSPAWAKEEAARCIQCECMECVKSCAYMQRFKKYPKPLVREAYNNLSIVMGNHGANALINACALCGQCEAVCPNGLNVGDACLAARRAMAETGKMPPSAHEFALLDMQFSLSEEWSLALSPDGPCDWAFFPGCQMGALLPHTLLSAFRDLREREEGKGGCLLSCCGAIAYWAGEEGLFEKALDALREGFEKLGSPKKVICGCPTCASMLSEHLGIQTEFAAVTLDRLGIAQKAGGAGRAALHDACGARSDKAAREAVRSIAQKAGVALEEGTGEEAGCCGWGGLAAFASPPTSEALAEKAAQIAGGGPSIPILSYCANCRDRFAKRGLDSLHILEAVYGREPGPVPSLGARRRNRKAVRGQLAKEFLGEEAIVKKRDFSVQYTDSALREMEERMILDEDMEEVLEGVRQGAPSAYEKESGLSIASRRIGNVTFWAKYTREGENYVVKGAYSHRMSVHRG
jgi:Fe-S oxidoreductase